MTAKVIVIGLDAAEATLLERGAAAGDLPAFAALTTRGSVYRLGNSLETLPGAIWPEIVSGRSSGKVPLYYHPRQLHSGEAVTRPVLADEVDPDDYYWSRVSAAGFRVASIDMPQTVIVPSFNGIQLFEWGLHDRNFAIASDPPELLNSVRAQFGDHPVMYCDRHGRVEEGYAKLLDGLQRGVETKSALLLDLLQREDWDLFTATYGETHCVGHQFWHFGDDRHPWHPENPPDAFRNAIADIYRRIDEGIGRLVAAAGPEATVLVVASHGMDLYTGGPKLLPEVLLRMGLGSTDRPTSRMTEVLRKAQGVLHHSPRPVQPFLKWLARQGPVKRVQETAGCLLNPLESSSTRAVALENNRCGAIRLNLKGREPFGSVAPGREADELLAEIRTELLALRDPASGEPIVDKVTTAVEAFGPDHHPDVPDLMVVFRTDLGRIERCRSDRLGDIEKEIYHPNIPRTGDHTVESRLWAAGPGVPARGDETAPGNVLDIAPTVLGLLGVQVPENYDGRPLDFAVPTMASGDAPA